MFENLSNFFKKIFKVESQKQSNSGKEAKERLHLVLMQDRANVSADFLDMMKQEIIEVIKKYIDVDENAIDVRLTNQTNNDGTNGAPALYANIPIVSIKENTEPTSNNDVGVDVHIDPEKTEQNTEPMSNNDVGVDVHIDQNKTEQNTEPTSNNDVGVDVHIDPNKTEENTEPMSNYDVGVDVHIDPDKTEHNTEPMSNDDVGADDNDDPNKTQQN